VPSGRSSVRWIRESGERSENQTVRWVYHFSSQDFFLTLPVERSWRKQLQIFATSTVYTLKLHFDKKHFVNLRTRVNLSSPARISTGVPRPSVGGASTDGGKRFRMSGEHESPNSRKRDRSSAIFLPNRVLDSTDALRQAHGRRGRWRCRASSKRNASATSIASIYNDLLSYSHSFAIICLLRRSGRRRAVVFY